MKKVSRTMVNFWLDCSLLILFLLLTWFSLILRYVFPPGTQAEGWFLWGRDYQFWCDLQFASLAALALAVLVHVMLHWSWICGVVATRIRRTGGAAARDDGNRTLWGVGLLIAIIHLIGLGFACALLSVHAPTYSRRLPFGISCSRSSFASHLGAPCTALQCG